MYLTPFQKLRDVMEIRRAVLLSAILWNLLTLECSVLLNSARAPSVNTQFALLGILKFLGLSNFGSKIKIDFLLEYE